MLYNNSALSTSAPRNPAASEPAANQKRSAHKQAKFPRQSRQSLRKAQKTRSSIEEKPPQLDMEIFGGLYMRSRLSPWSSLRAEVKMLKKSFFGGFKLVFGCLIFTL